MRVALLFTGKQLAIGLASTRTVDHCLHNVGIELGAIGSDLYRSESRGHCRAFP
jgi:hypothetical protein